MCVQHSLDVEGREGAGMAVSLLPMPDDDLHRLIEGDDPDDAMAPILGSALDAWALFDTLSKMESAMEAHKTIAVMQPHRRRTRHPQRRPSPTRSTS